jgi:hypothetical protein
LMEYDIITKKDNEKDFWDMWDCFIDKECIGPRYTRLAILNFLEMSRSRGFFESDESFILADGNEPVACAFVPVEKKDGNRSVSFNGTYTMAPLFKGKDVAKKVFSKIDEKARELKVDKIMFQADPLEELHNSHNFLAQFKYLNTSILTYLLYLKGAGDFLKSSRRGHKCDIKKLLNDKRFSTFVVDQNNPDYVSHEAYRELHRKAAGRITRSKESFDSQFKKLQCGNATLVGIRYENKIMACAYFEEKSGKAIYASGADDPEFNGFPLYHLLIFTAMNYYAEKGTSSIDVGQPVNPGAQFDYYPDDKQLKIAFFKRGFPGKFRDHYRGIKYFNKNTLDHDIDVFREKYEIDH